tara:strand:- start:1 stop:240 length:240 start_codon:yes stop_codon:yes gene_type:complete
MRMLTGTLEVDANDTTSAIFTTKTRIVQFILHSNQTDDDGVIPRVHINASDFSATAANGSVHVQGIGAPDVYQFTCYYY